MAGTGRVVARAGPPAQSGVERGGENISRRISVACAASVPGQGARLEENPVCNWKPSET